MGGADGGRRFPADQDGRFPGPGDNTGVPGRVADSGGWRHRYSLSIDLHYGAGDDGRSGGLELRGRVGGHGHLRALDRNPLRSGYLDIAALEFKFCAGGVYDHALGALHHNRAVAVDLRSAAGRVEGDAQLAVPGFGLDAVGAALVVEQVDAVAAPRNEGPPVHRTGTRVDHAGTLAVRRGDTVVEPAQDVGPLRITDR